MVRLNLFYQKSYYLLCLLLFFSCSERYDLYDEATFLDAYALKKAKSDYKNEFGNQLDYETLYSNPQWDQMTKLNNCDSIISYYVPLPNDSKDFYSYLIINRESYNISYFILNLPSQYSDIETYRKEPDKLLLFKDNEQLLGHLLCYKQTVYTRGYQPVDENYRGNNGITLPEVVIIASKKDRYSWDDGWWNKEYGDDGYNIPQPAGINNIIHQNAEDGGGGSSTGGGLPGADNKTTDSAPDVDPCKAASQAEKDQALVQRAQELLDKVSNYRAGDKEYGWVKTTDGRIIRPADVGEGRMKYNSSQLSNVKIVERYHNHPGGGGAFPSWADLISLSNDYKQGRIDVDNFSYGVVSEFGCLSLVITSEEAFKIFANKVSSDDKVIKGKYNNMSTSENTNVDAMIGKYIDFLTSAISGLEVLYSPAEEINGRSSLGIWGAKISNGNGGIKSNDCGK